MSRRTDGGPAQAPQKMSGLPYGENDDFNEMQSSAPLAASPTPASNPAPTRGGGPAAATQLMSPSGRPEEPVTAGAGVGPGETPPQGYEDTATEDMKRLKSYLPDLEIPLLWEGTPKTYKMLVAYIRNA